MSDAAWRMPQKSLPQYFGEDDNEGVRARIPKRKVSLALPTERPSYQDMKVYYIGTLDAKGYRRVKVHQVAFNQEGEAAPQTLPSVSVSSHQKARYPALYAWLGVLVFILFIGGAVLTAFKPSPLTGLGVPLAFTLWAGLAYMIRRADRRTLDA
jgi:hypothetical protein